MEDRAAVQPEASTCAGSYTCVPSRSAGSRSGVNWMRRNVEVEHAREGAHRRGLGESGHALDQHVPLAEQRDQQAVDQLALADQHARHLACGSALPHHSRARRSLPHGSAGLGDGAASGSSVAAARPGSGIRLPSVRTPSITALDAKPTIVEHGSAAAAESRPCRRAVPSRGSTARSGSILAEHHVAHDRQAADQPVERLQERAARHEVGLLARRRAGPSRRCRACGAAAEQLRVREAEPAVREREVQRPAWSYGSGRPSSPLTPESDGSRASATRAGSFATLPSFSSRCTSSSPSVAKSPPGRSAPAMLAAARRRGPITLSAGRSKVAAPGSASKSRASRSNAKGARSPARRASSVAEPATVPPRAGPHASRSDTIERSASSCDLRAGRAASSPISSVSSAIFPDSQRGPVVGSPGAVASPGSATSTSTRSASDPSSRRCSAGAPPSTPWTSSAARPPCGKVQPPRGLAQRQDEGGVAQRRDR